MQKLILSNKRNQNIVGNLTKPTRKIIGTAILQHGYCGKKEHPQIIALQEVFLENGFQVFNFDSPNSFGESDGNYEDARLGLHADDFEYVVNWVKKQSWFIGKLLVSGHSMGGFASIRYALRNPQSVDMVISLAPVISGELLWASQRKYYPDQFKQWRETGMRSKKLKMYDDMLIQSPWEIMQEYLNHSLLIENNENPDLLLIACEKDTICLTEHIKIFHDSLQGKKDFKILKSSRHVPRSDDLLMNLKNIINSWLKNK